jgi:sugar (pentulose or hexulose) kinase
LNQATANATARQVLAGPLEATAAGNVLVQAIACGEVRSLVDAREVLGRSVKAKRYAPLAGDAWARARERYGVIEAGMT